MRKIRETIVVEGRHDTENLRKYFDCATIETGGTSLSEEVISRIREAARVTGVIVLTDPDAPGNMIRNRVNAAVPGCLNAFVNKKDARTEKKVGVEHAGMQALEEALDNLVTYSVPDGEEISAADMAELGLSGTKDAADRRLRLGEALHIGNANAKTFRRRLNHLGISKEEIRKVLIDE